MKEMFYKRLGVFILIILLTGCHSNEQKDNNTFRTITDMAGREVMVPIKIERIFCADMTTTMLVYSLSADLLVGINNPIEKENRKYLKESFCNLPVLGRIFIGKSQLNEEALIQIHPDILVCPVFRFTAKTDLEGFEKTADRLGIPAVLVKMEMEHLEETYLFLGKLLNCNAWALELSQYCKRTMDFAFKVKAIQNYSTSVYIAEGVNGLNTIPSGSAHSQIFDMVGLKNCAKIDERYGYTNMQINMEQLIGWNPDLILLGGRTEIVNKNNLVQNKQWQTLDAVKQNQIRTIPNKPFNWVGRPPGINRLIGIYWLALQTEPELLEKSINKEVADFYQEFYHVNLTIGDLNEILN
jgi:iron complex transport system substrate-binding protein